MILEGRIIKESKGRLVEVTAASRRKSESMESLLTVHGCLQLCAEDQLKARFLVSCLRLLGPGHI